MPYIDKEKREILDTFVKGRSASNVGELNYMITRLCLGYLRTHGLKYKTCNDILGAVDAASKEFYRRVVAPYENLKIEANGDVY